ncbi:hypothetical protein [Shewanella colwelliana]|uniref:hypothetical protein n=1 Tax=Shewanella colwelliana TaxID=23 RepID=UPI0022B0378F|nr:hypothetical protein [Shewanella colwelliana]MCZ4337811.1 hypothetical protein [Shewanella colwelliana]
MIKTIRTHKGMGLPMVLLVLVALAMAFYSFVFAPYYNYQKIEEISGIRPSPTLAQSKLLDSYKMKPGTPPITGQFRFEGKQDGKEVIISYYFSSDQLVTKELVVDGKYKVTGTAKYTNVGSVLVYTDISGDKVVFPEIGEAVTFVEGKSLTIHNPEQDLLLKPV